eukprot:TRINITY_DN9474_c0_g1_i2.p1 TRINITY_DN9474_c0_g1~~TRINITY_DN9474_c0_g1_i2.p1  ORF type:complete len:284 (-),score=37.42 TRINITY_DN9474_c0_g1_i2:3-854(-)
MQARLEQVADRLEQVAARLEKSSQQKGGDVGRVGGTEKASAPAPKSVGGTAQQAASGASAPDGNSVQAFQELIRERVHRLTEIAQKLPQEVQKITGVLQKAFEEELKVVDAISQCKPPDSMYLRKLVSPVSEQMKAATQIADGPRSDYTNHNRAISESMQAMAWVVYTGPSSGMDPPGQMIAGTMSVSEVYLNRIVMNYRGKNEDQVAWSRGVKNVFMDLKAYVEQYHRNGPSWDRVGKDVPSFLSKGGSQISMSSPAPSASATQAAPWLPSSSSTSEIKRRK